MIAKSGTGQNFGGLLNYINKDDSETLKTNNLYNINDLKSLKFQLESIAAVKTRLKSPVFHASLSIQKGDTLTNDEWIKASETYLKTMGFDIANTQYLVKKHNDNSHEHVHLIVNRVSLKNEVWNDSYHKRRSHEASAAAALSIGREPVLKGEKTSEFAKILNFAKSQSGNRLAKYINVLNDMGIQVKLNQSKTTGHISGISYLQNDKFYKASSIGREFTLSALQKSGMTLDIDAPQQTSQNALNALNIGGGGGIANMMDDEIKTDGKSKLEIENQISVKKIKKEMEKIKKDEQDKMHKLLMERIARKHAKSKTKKSQFEL